jgi:hypothetical protein
VLALWGYNFLFIGSLKKIYAVQIYFFSHLGSFEYTKKTFTNY